jgi:hypothetical protein
MGAWGYGIEENDTVLDVRGTFGDALRESQSLDAATAAVRDAYTLRKPRAHHDAHVRIGLALSQWRYGALDPALLDAIRADLAAGRGIREYDDPAARRKVVSAFVARLSKPNPRPRALPKPPKAPKRTSTSKPRPTPFAAGECLAVYRPRKGHHAALVVVADERDGTNYVARLEWTEKRAPALADFAKFAGAGKPLPKAPKVTELANMYGPRTGTTKFTPLGRIDVDPARFGLARTSTSWKKTKPPLGIAFREWRDLVEPPERY